MKRVLGLSILTAFLGIWLVSCLYAQNGAKNSCTNPEFGYAEEGFVNCKPQDAFARLNALAAKGSPKALYMLSRIYDMGGKYYGLPKVKQNGDLTMQYLLKSAQSGYAEAQAMLGLFYWRDYRETRQKEALYWTCRAAMQDYPNAVAGIQLRIKVAELKQTVSQYCAPILKSPPKQKGQG